PPRAPARSSRTSSVPWSSPSLLAAAVLDVSYVDACRRPLGSRCGSHLAPPQPRGDDRQEGGLRVGGILEVMGQVGVEGDAIALAQLVALSVADQGHRPALHERRLAAAGLVHRRVVRRARGAPGREGVAGKVAALAPAGRGAPPPGGGPPG